MSHVLKLRVPTRYVACAADGEGAPAGSASDSDLAKINAMPGVIEPLSAEDVFVFSCEAISTRVLLNGLQMPEESLRQLAALAYDHPIQRNHDTWTSEGLPIGRIFESSVGPDSRGDLCNLQRFYMVREPLTESLAKRMKGGIITEDSVSFAHDTLKCSICQTDLYQCSHLPLEQYDGKTCLGIVLDVCEYFETSLVWAGMADGTRIRMAASRDGELEQMLARKVEASAKDRREVEWVAEWAKIKNVEPGSAWSEDFFKPSEWPAGAFGPL